MVSRTARQSAAEIRRVVGGEADKAGRAGCPFAGKLRQICEYRSSMSCMPMTRPDARALSLKARARCWAIFGVVSLALPAASALADTAFDSLLGSWAGSGQIRYQDGRSESVRCTAYYTEGGQRLKLAIRCRSSSNEIEIRGQLVARGDVVSGTWDGADKGSENKINNRKTF
jgi:hypothetical protein